MESATQLSIESLKAVRMHRSELRESMAALEQALAAPAPGRARAWAERVHVALVELSSDLRVHREVAEGPGGLHADIVGSAPRLAGPVVRLAADHVAITQAVEDLLDRLSVPLADDEVADVRERGVALLGRLVRHRQAGADLVFEAYEVDVGGGE